MKRQLTKTDPKTPTEKGKGCSKKPRYPVSLGNVLPTTTATHPHTLGPLVDGTKAVYQKEYEVRRKLRKWIHKISCQENKNLLTLFQNLSCVYFRMP